MCIYRGKRMIRPAAWLACGLSIGLAGCGGGGMSRAAHQLRYIGALPGCGLPEATLVRQADQFAFTPGDGVLVINGAVAADGQFSGTLDTQPPGKPPFLLTVKGHIGPEQANLDYTTPRCHAAATLNRVHPSLL